MTFCPGLYQAFGLTIRSDVALEELAPAGGDAPPDLIIRKTGLGRPLPPRGSAPVFDYYDERGVVMIWPGVAGFRLVGDDLVEVEPYPDAPERFLAFPILGPVMAWMLERKGLLVLHSSAVAIDGKSVCFLGDKMAGKSTTAAAFLRNGAQLVTDDLLAIEMVQGSAPSIRPAFAQLKLSDQSAAAVQLEDAQALPLVYEGFAKRQHKLATMHAEPIGVDLILVLDRGPPRPAISRLSSSDAFVALMRYSYGVRFANAPPELAERAQHFRHCVGLANLCEVGRLEVPADLNALDAVVAEVRRHLAQGGRDA
jgi:hypothetical protein